MNTPEGERYGSGSGLKHLRTRSECVPNIPPLHRVIRAVSSVFGYSRANAKLSTSLGGSLDRSMR